MLSENNGECITTFIKNLILALFGVMLKTTYKARLYYFYCKYEYYSALELGSLLSSSAIFASNATNFSRVLINT